MSKKRKKKDVGKNNFVTALKHREGKDREKLKGNWKIERTLI